MEKGSLREGKGSEAYAWLCFLWCLSLLILSTLDIAVDFWGRNGLLIKEIFRGIGL